MWGDLSFGVWQGAWARWAAFPHLLVQAPNPQTAPAFVVLRFPAALLTSGRSLWGGQCGVWTASLAGAPPVVTTSGDNLRCAQCHSTFPRVTSPQGRALLLDSSLPTGPVLGILSRELCSGSLGSSDHCVADWLPKCPCPLFLLMSSPIHHDLAACDVWK